MFHRNRFALYLLALGFVSGPFLFAAGYWGPDWVFGGFLANPIDGASYLAKMQEGWAGGWKFTLLYSSTPTSGAYLFLFYLFLGHLARLLGVPLLIAFHVARILAALGLLLSLARLCDQLFPNDTGSANRALWLAACGSGLGWIALLVSGRPGVDFLVAEGYPFLSMFTNPHFPLGLALILWIFIIDTSPARPYQRPLMALLGLLLSIIQPFGLVIAAGLMGLRFLWTWLSAKTFSPWNVCWGLSLGGPFLVYQYWAIYTDPVLASWNQQNVTLAPELWDFLLSLSPAFLLALGGIGIIWTQRRNLAWLVLAGWLALGIGLVYLPFSLQRRFMTGLYVPVALLAVLFCDWLAARFRWGKRVYPLLLGASLLTNLLFLLVATLGAAGPAQQDEVQPIVAQAEHPRPAAESVYLPRQTLDALVWLRDNTPLESVVLADVETGLFVPAWSGRRTVYGHPFETSQADREKKAVEAFFSERMSASEKKDFISNRGIDLILWPESAATLDGRVVYDRGGVRISEVQP